MVSNKHMATFLLGAAAAFGAYKYFTMTDEEKEKLAGTLKDKAGKLKDQAMAAEDKAADYFKDLKTKGADALKEHFPQAGEFFKNLFGKEEPKAEEPAAAATGS